MIWRETYSMSEYSFYFFNRITRPVTQGRHRHRVSEHAKHEVDIHSVQVKQGATCPATPPRLLRSPEHL